MHQQILQKPKLGSKNNCVEPKNKNRITVEWCDFCLSPSRDLKVAATRAQ